MHKNLKRGLNRSGVDHGAKTWPGLPELVLLRILEELWPTSDMHHVVVSPARLLMGSYLGLCKIRSFSDAASGLFLCTLFLQYETLSKRFVPEAISFLTSTVLSLSPRRGAPAESGRISPTSQRHHIRQLCGIRKGEAKRLSVNRPDLVAVISDKRASPQTNVDLLGLTVDLLARFAESSKGLDGFVELYGPVLQILGDIDLDALCPSLQVRLKFYPHAFPNYLQEPNISDLGLYPEALEVLPPGAPSSTPPSTQAYPHSLIHPEV
jgi:nucleolar protein 14